MNEYEDIIASSPTARLLVERITKLEEELPKLRQIALIAKKLTEDAGNPMITAFCRVVFKPALDSLYPMS